MHQDTSANRQNELLRELTTLNEQFGASKRELAESLERQVSSLQHQYSGQRQHLAHQTLLQRDQTENGLQQQLLAVNEEFTSLLKSVSAEFNEKSTAAQSAAKTAKSDGEYDWFLSKQRLKKEFEADQLSIQDDYKKSKARLKAHGSEYADLVSMAKETLARHGCQLKVQGGDLLEDPEPSDHLADHLQTYRQIEELVRQFRLNTWVRFQQERWYLIAFLIGLVGAAYPLNLALKDVALTGVAAFGVGIIASVVAYYISRAMAKKTADQFHPPFVNAIATGKKQLLSAQHQNKQQRENSIARLNKDTKRRGDEMDAEWKDKLNEIESRTSHRLQELKTWVEKKTTTLNEQKSAKVAEIEGRFLPRLDELQSNLESETTRLSDTENSSVRAVQEEHDAKLHALTDDWTERTSAIRAELATISTIAKRSMVDFEGPAANWTFPEKPLDAVHFGSLQASVASNDDAEVTSTNETLDALNLPAALDLLHRPTLSIQTNAAGRDTAMRTLKVAMLRMLSAIPVGKLRFTIVDPVGLGQEFSAFMHLADHDEQLVNHRIWTEPKHINDRLTELTQHMENVIQTYLRNEFSSIQQYNEQAGEVAEAFRVLVVANFPAGFSDEAASRLLSIVKSGPRCGVFTLLSLDPTQKMPRNFDLEELQGSSDVMISHDDLRFQDSPLNDFPVTLDTLPNETKFSQIMHEIGSRAKDSNRVEVPFSAVAPAEDGWWLADGRSELTVPLGRAGAMKLQSLQLGKGTSQHVLISGKTGSGKSTLLHAMITNLALTYAPTEVQFYLIDFKKGVEFKAYAEHKLPHARVIAIESEREFGQSVLQRLDVELRRRGDLFRRVGVQSLAGYRDARPDEHMPRILLIIDEFQEFFVKEDKIAQEASLLLDRLVRQGRAFGIHVILGSQTLAGAYSLARATIGQMAVRIALQCSASDAHLILSDDNDAARLLRRPGEAIYNDANGMVEGNHPFQVVWLSDHEKDELLRQISAKQQSTIALAAEAGDIVQPTNAEQTGAPIVFEGNTAAQLDSNEMLRKAWHSPAPNDVPLAPRAWLGEAIAIKEAPATVFHRRSGSNLLLVGQQEESALGVMASSLLSLGAFSPQTDEGRTKFIVLDGTRPEAEEAGYWERLSELSGLDVTIAKPREAVDVLASVANEVATRDEQEQDDRPATFLFIYNLSRFRELQKSDDDFGFGSFSEKKQASSAEQLADILRNGPARGVHTILWSDTHTNLMRWIDRQSLRDVTSRVLFQMSATDSSNLMDSSAASQLGVHRAVFYSEDQGRAERFRPYGLPSDEFLSQIKRLVSSPEERSRSL